MLRFRSSLDLLALRACRSSPCDRRVAIVPAVAQEPEPATRAEVLEREREAKSQALTPPEMGRAERTLLALENSRFFERLLAPPEGFYPKIGNITAGSGFAVAPAYRRPRLFGEQGVLTTFAAVSYKRYWMLDAKLELPELADGRVFSDVHGRMFEFPSEDFFGIGPASLRGEEATYTASGAHRWARPEGSGRCRGFRSEQLWTS